MDLKELSLLIQKGNAKKVKEFVLQALQENISPEAILNEGLIAGMSVIGMKFKNNEVCVPEVLISARAMNAGMEILEPILTETGVKPIGKAVVGTVKGDLHDIGKNLVKMMLKGSGIEVIDLGVDVSAETFVNKAEEVGADIIGLSALLTTTLSNMKSVIDELNKRDLREKYIVMVGGAPVNHNFAKEIGADFYAPDAASASEKAKEVLAKSKTF
jgi:corrinoid protein of di/trimethylamine methyltransferase